jgi:purine nucleosidase
MPLPILLDTDIGTDIDDAYALILAAASPELDLRGVTTVNSDTVLRARIAKLLLRMMDREDVPVSVGEAGSLTHGVERGFMGHEGRGIDLTSIHPDTDFDPRPAAQFIGDATRAAHEAGTPLTIITIGALTNLALALRECPDDLALAGGVIAMASNYQGFGEEQACGEHNVACDTVALEAVLRSGLLVTLVGLNVTNQTWMDRGQVERFAALGGPLAEALASMHRIWFEAIRADRTPMHDGLAVAAAFRPDLLELEPVSARVLHDAPAPGTVLYNPPDPAEVTRCWIAKSVDAPAFHDLLYGRVEEVIRQASGRGGVVE